MVKKMEKKRTSTSSKGSSDPKLLKQEIKGQVFGEVMGEVDQKRAVKLRAEYGRVGWLLSWYPQEDEFWLVRLSSPNYPETVEALGQSRCLAIDSATRHMLDLLHHQANDSCKNHK
jgi:hypothetical protein